MALMACACKGRKTSYYLWTSEDGTEQVRYETEIQAKAKVMRRGGSYETKPAT